MRRTYVAVALLLLVACTPDRADVTAGPLAVAGPSGGAQAEPDALAFTAGLVGGGTFDGGEYAGQDLMLWFWAPW